MDTWHGIFANGGNGMSVRERVFLLVALAWGLPSLLHASEQDGTIGALLKNHCVRCHNAKVKKGGVDLTGLANEKDLPRQRKLIRRVLEQVESQSMPPAPEPALGERARDQVLRWATQALVLSEAKDPAERNPGSPLIRRLNRNEYNRTLRDLVGLDFDVAGAVGMVEDTTSHSFDNIADALTLSPVLMEKYFAGADLLLTQLFKDPPGDAKKKAEHQKILDGVLIARPGKDLSAGDAARRTIEAFSRRAFRRPVAKTEIDRLLKLFAESQTKGESYDLGVKHMLKAVLVSPYFLFRIERPSAADGTKAYRIDDHELAVRLSYFLWSSMPDAELFRLAEEKKLSDAETLAKQVRRMLMDSKASALTESFAGQWTKIRKLDDARPSIESFPTFTSRLKQAMTQEVLTFFDALRREDRSVLELLDANYTYVNEDLANHYGIKGIKGPEMQKVTLKEENHRGGLTGMAGILALTSHTSRTSPTLRGKWVLEVVFGTPPEPPPPDAGQIKEEKQKGKEVTSFRELLQRHARDAGCAGCHRKIDPLGFGLENFDPIGRWRPAGGVQKIDASGTLPSGEKFNGAKELKQLFLKRKGEFVRNITEQMLSYALGREIKYYDEATVQALTMNLEKNDFRFGVLIQSVVQSYPFQYRRNAVAGGE